MHLARGGVESGEQLIGSVSARFGQQIEQGGFARIGVAHQRNPKGLAALTRTALGVALAFDLHESLFHRLDSLADHAAVEFDLRFTRTTTVTNAATLPLEVTPAAHQARRQILQPGQFNLQFAFVALSTVAKDLKNQHGAVCHRHAEVTLEVALLGCAQRLIEQHHLGLVHGDEQLDLIGFAAAHEKCRIRALATRNDARDRQVSGRLCEQGEFIERLIE